MTLHGPSKCRGPKKHRIQNTNFANKNKYQHLCGVSIWTADRILHHRQPPTTNKDEDKLLKPSDISLLSSFCLESRFHCPGIGNRHLSGSSSHGCKLSTLVSFWSCTASWLIDIQISLGGDFKAPLNDALAVEKMGFFSEFYNLIRQSGKFR